MHTYRKHRKTATRFLLVVIIVSDSFGEWKKKAGRICKSSRVKRSIFFFSTPIHRNTNMFVFVMSCRRKSVFLFVFFFFYFCLESFWKICSTFYSTEIDHRHSPTIFIFQILRYSQRFFNFSNLFPWFQSLFYHYSCFIRNSMLTSISSIQS